jgi:hypothetical protein
MCPLPDGFTSEFVEALRLIGSAMEELRSTNLQCPVLVGGAALQLWTTGRYVSGDFDLVGVDPTPMETALIARGFRREDRRGHLMRGLYHPTLDIGVEFVSGRLFDGNADLERLRLVTVGPGSRVLVIPVEEVIADRLGQYAANPAGSRALLRQAALAWSLAVEIDRPYLDQRIKTETIGTLDLVRFEELVAHETDQP